MDANLIQNVVSLDRKMIIRDITFNFQFNRNYLHFISTRFARWSTFNARPSFLISSIIENNCMEFGYSLGVKNLKKSQCEVSK